MCFKCALGSYSSSQGQSVCSACDTGKFSPSGDVPRSSCTPCPKGGYCADPGASPALAFKQCEAGTYNDEEGKSEAIACKACPVGKANPIPNSIELGACKDCLPGSIADEEGTGICQL